MAAHADPSLEHPTTCSATFTGDNPVDDNVLDSLPPGTKALSAEKLGDSTWSHTARLNVTQADGNAMAYFLKWAEGDAGRLMMEGEFNSMLELYSVMPEFVPMPLTWGNFSTPALETYFFMSEFIDMSACLPEPDQFCTKLAKLHKTSISPTAKFGFHRTTCQGRIPQAVSWEGNWTIFFSSLLRNVIELDDAENGCWHALTVLEKRLLSHVVPYLLNNLTKDGRVIKPCLIHGDLWEGNIRTSQTGNIFVFDAAVMYAHNEFEIGNWRCHYNRICDQVYTRTYCQHYPPSEPEEEWDDRNRLYCIYYNVLYSVNHQSEGKAVRQRAFDDMYHLIDKYAPFPDSEGPTRLSDEERAELPNERDHTKN
ncbi:hypothetical protein H2204_000498 [Knufia peltigerae]|uniref:protein-ribulosamine 3-kinase n=1 Tax=Knufia peltigerae TaxID=1002370 RepID=A0AA38YES0_9EURO|nr:hypothetical protein H2204_000498 [Knufia peltigerae]